MKGPQGLGISAVAIFGWQGNNLDLKPSPLKPSLRCDPFPFRKCSRSTFLGTGQSSRLIALFTQRTGDGQTAGGAPLEPRTADIPVDRRIYAAVNFYKNLC